MILKLTHEAQTVFLIYAVEIYQCIQSMNALFYNLVAFWIWWWQSVGRHPWRYSLFRYLYGTSVYTYRYCASYAGYDELDLLPESVLSLLNARNWQLIWKNRPI